MITLNGRRFTCTITMIADTIGGPIITARKIPLTMSLKNNHGVCCIKVINVRIQAYINFATETYIVRCEKCQ